MNPLALKPDEKAILLEIAENSQWKGHNGNLPCFNAVMRDKRSAYVVSKFNNWGWVDFGVSLRCGWLTPEGLDAATKVKGT